jgi:MFS family permease
MAWQTCKICETGEGVEFNLFPDVCDNCVKYDWGHWRIATANRIGFGLGCLVGLFWVSGQDLSTYQHPLIIGFFTMLVGGVVGAAFAASVAGFLFERYLMQPPGDADESQLAREAEKFFYVALLSAFQGKTEYAVRMLRQAHLHGWRRWDRLTGDPRFQSFCRHSDVRHLVQH